MGRRYELNNRPFPEEKLRQLNQKQSPKKGTEEILLHYLGLIRVNSCNSWEKEKLHSGLNLHHNHPHPRNLRQRLTTDNWLLTTAAKQPIFTTCEATDY